MRAVRYEEYGGPEVLHVAEVPEPHAGPGQIRVAVRAAGVNAIDWKIRSGMMSGGQPLAEPRIPGVEAAGVVDEVGDGVDGVSPGDEVLGHAIGGGFAEYTLMEHFAGKPAGMSWPDAAALPVAVETATRLLDMLGVRAGMTVLINGASGGVGAVAVQLAVARGASVIGTTSEANHEYVGSIGATPVTYGDGLPDRVKALGVGPVDVAFDTAGRGALPDLIAITGSPDSVMTIADPAAAQYGVRYSGGGGNDPRGFYALADAVRMSAEDRLRLPVARTFTLDKVGEAQRISQDGHVRGKLVVVID
jgi:NADPH:quinone reductase-like Zn-dependent oxidoreductase